MQPDLTAGARGLALGRGFLRQRAGVNKGDPVMLVVVADKADELVLVQYLRPENRAVPVAHLVATIGLQHEMREFLRLRHGHDILPGVSPEPGRVCAIVPGSIPGNSTRPGADPQASPRASIRLPGSAGFV